KIVKLDKEDWKEQIFRIISRIIGTALQKDTITGKYADDFERYREEIYGIIHQLLEKARQEEETKWAEKLGEADGRYLSARQEGFDEGIRTKNSGRKMYQIGRKEAIEEVLKISEEMKLERDTFYAKNKPVEVLFELQKRIKKLTPKD
ncbi:MAG: hypothetical protein AABY22_17500, partial [Nanoarchaeota archaeon]